MDYDDYCREAERAFTGRNPPETLPRLRSSWNSTRMLVRGPLTDRKIEKYRKQGWYSEAFRQARKEAWAKKFKRKGNFIEHDGRMIYTPS